MKGIHRKIWFWIAIALILIAVVVLISRRKIDGRLGGILRGPSHEDGGIKAEIRSNGETIELEGNENILTAKVNEMPGTYVCEGTLGGIAGAVNKTAGGIEFDKNGRCWIKQ